MAVGNVRCSKKQLLDEMFDEQFAKKLNKFKYLL